MRRWLGGIGVVVGLAGVVRGQEPPQAPERPVYQVVDFGVMPRPSFLPVLLTMPAIQAELKVEANQASRAAAEARAQLTRLTQVGRQVKDPQQRQAAVEAVMREIQVTLIASLGAEGYDRLREIQLQAQGPLAFIQSPPFAPVADGAGLGPRLGLTDEQARRIRPIAEAGDEEITRAAAFPIGLDPRGGPPPPEAIRLHVTSPEFLAAKRHASEVARLAWAGVMERIERELTADQRTSYHALLGTKFDLTRITLTDDPTGFDADRVAIAFNARGGQRADPNFDTRVARPAYRANAPRVRFDEAHGNFHTADGRYRPFTALITSDGYAVTPNRTVLTRESLAGADILISANAMSLPTDGPGATESAFTDAEADAVRDWVQAGGSLLLITDHEPFGSGSANLAQRFGVATSKKFTIDPANFEGDESHLVFTRAQLD